MSPYRTLAAMAAVLPSFPAGAQIDDDASGEPESAGPRILVDDIPSSYGPEELNAIRAVARSDGGLLVIGEAPTGHDVGSGPGIVEASIEAGSSAVAFEVIDFGGASNGLAFGLRIGDACESN